VTAAGGQAELDRDEHHRGQADIDEPDAERATRSFHAVTAGDAGGAGEWPAPARRADFGIAKFTGLVMVR
jgi:hypothetical protein